MWLLGISQTLSPRQGASVKVYGWNRWLQSQ